MSLSDSLSKMYDIQKMLADYRFRSEYTPTEVAAALIHYLRKLPEYDRDIAEKLADAFDLELQLADARQLHAPNSSQPPPSQVTLFELGLRATLGDYHCAKCNRDFRCTQQAFDSHLCESASTTPPPPLDARHGSLGHLPPAISGMVDLAKLPELVKEVEAAIPKEGSSDEDMALKAASPDAYEELMSIRAKVEALQVRLGPLGKNGSSAVG